MAMIKLQLQYTPKRKTEVWGFHDNDCVEITDRRIHKLNYFESFIWERCNGRCTINEMIQAWVDKCYTTDATAGIELDVLELLEAWKNENLLIMDFDFLHSASEYDDSCIYHIEANVMPPVDILLLTAPTPSPMTHLLNEQSPLLENLGIGYMSAYLRSRGFSVGTMHLWDKQVNPATILDIITRYSPKIVGISSMTDTFENGIRVADIIKQFNNDITIIFGGPHVTFMDESTLLHHKSVDVVVRGEGEYSLMELANLFLYNVGELSGIYGITYWEGNRIIRTKDRQFINDLDVLPFPDRLDYRKDAFVGVQTSRGCPGKCIFCSARGLSGGKYRMRSAENVVSEIEMLLNKGVSLIFFQDDTLTADINRLNEILNLIEKRGLLFKWSAESRVDVIDRNQDIVKRMASCGCFTIQLGIESGSQAMLDALKKNITIDQVYRTVSLMRQEGILTKCSFLIGHPYETYSTMLETFEFAKKLIDLGSQPVLCATCPYPGTSITDNPESYNVEIMSCDYSNYNTLSPIMDTNNLTAREIKKYLYLYTIALDNYYKSRKVQILKEILQ